MNFFQHQDEARQSTRRLVFLFSLAVIFLSVATYAAAVGIMMFSSANSRIIMMEGRGPWWWSPELFAYCSGGTILLIALGSMWKISQLAQGGASVAMAMGGHPVDHSTAGPAEKRLLNVVEEMAIASGVPVPDVFVLRDEKGLNAFAAGLTTQTAAVAVTEGMLEELSRDELQGVIAHEFSHIFNGDMRLNIRLIGVLHGILLLYLLGRILLEAGSRRTSSRKNNTAVIAIAGLALMAIGSLGLLMCRLIQSAVSRQREFLADASAVQFTRNPGGIGGALRKLAGHSTRVRHPGAEEAAHMFFGAALSSMFATHPPLEERIRRIEGVKVEGGPRIPEVSGTGGGSAGLATAGVSSFSEGKTLNTRRMVERAGDVRQEDIQAAGAMLGGFPADLKTASEETLSAQALVLGILLSRDDSVFRQQMALLAACKGGLDRECRRLLPSLAALPLGGRLPLAELCFPALRRMSAPQFSKFKETLQAFIRADNKIEPFEYALHRMVLRHLQPHFVPAAPLTVKYERLRGDAVTRVRHLLGVLSHVGHPIEKDAGVTFQAGARSLGVSGWILPPRAECSLEVLDAALTELQMSAPLLKEKILRAASVAISHDGMVTPREADLFRAIADALDCPVPLAA